MKEVANMNSSDFAYTATIKLNELRKCSVTEDFPRVADLAVQSRHFNNYFDCASSMKSFMGDVLDKVNAEALAGDQYVVTTEVNPVYSGVDTKSTDWIQGELARLWLFDSKQEESVSIYAVGQARVFLIPREPGKYVN